MRQSILFAAALAMAVVSAPVMADAGDWLARVGYGYIDPEDDGGNLNGTTQQFEVDGAGSMIFEITYMIDDNFAVELLGAWPFEHDVKLEGAGDIAETKHLPPTLSLQYHWTRWGAFKPYVGAGVNYTYFFDEDTKGALSSSDIDLGDSWGLAYQVGADYSFNDNWFVNANVRYINIETDADVDNVDAGNVKVDPWLFGASIGYRF